MSARVSLSLAAMALTLCVSAQGEVVARDDLDREVRLPNYPQRIVSLLPSLTETVCELEACDRLVATDRYSNWPPSVQSLPKTGGLEDAQIEEIVRLHPDLVLVSRSQRITGRLDELQIKSFVMETQTYAAIPATIDRIAHLLGLDARAAPLKARIESASAALVAREAAKHPGLGPTVYFEVDRAPYAAGAASFIGEMLSRLKARNIIGPELGPFPKINPEYVVRHNPDVIFVAPAEIEHLQDRPGWNDIRAVREHRLCSFPPQIRDVIVRPGPRVIEGMQALADCLDKVAP
jgi:iron complex transport system substrate-binding protein